MLKLLNQNGKRGHCKKKKIQKLAKIPVIKSVNVWILKKWCSEYETLQNDEQDLLEIINFDKNWIPMVAFWDQQKSHFLLCSFFYILKS